MRSIKAIMASSRLMSWKLKGNVVPIKARINGLLTMDRRRAIAPTEINVKHVSFTGLILTFFCALKRIKIIDMSIVVFESPNNKNSKLM
jgi:hypothetical protein